MNRLEQVPESDNPMFVRRLKDPPNPTMEEFIIELNSVEKAVVAASKVQPDIFPPSLFTICASVYNIDKIVARFTPIKKMDDDRFKMFYAIGYEMVKQKQLPIMAFMVSETWHSAVKNGVTPITRASESPTRREMLTIDCCTFNGLTMFRCFPIYRDEKGGMVLATGDVMNLEKVHSNILHSFYQGVKAACDLILDVLENGLSEQGDDNDETQAE